MPYFFRCIFSLSVSLLLLFLFSSDTLATVAENSDIASDSTTAEVDTAEESVHTPESVTFADSSNPASTESVQSDSAVTVPIEKPDSTPSTSGWYNGYIRSQRGGRGVSSSGGPVGKKTERRRVVEDTTTAIPDSFTVATTTDTMPDMQHDSSHTFSLHKISTRSKIIAGVSTTAIVGGVITFFLVKKVNDQIQPDPPLPDPPSPPDF